MLVLWSLLLALSELLTRNYEYEVKNTFFLLSLDVFHGCLKLKLVFVCNMLLVRSYRLVCSGRGLKQGNVYEFKNLGMLVLLLIG